MAQAESNWKVSQLDVDKDGLPDVVVEGELLRVAIAARGGGITGFYDKIRHHEEAKTFPSANDDGLNQLRIAGVANDADTARFQLSHRAGENGAMIVEATGDVTLTLNDEKIGPMRVLRRYVLEPDASRVRVVTRFENRSTQDVNFVPWVKHLLIRDGTQPSGVAFMTPYGVFDSQKPIPGRGGQMYVGNVHYITSSNWITRTPEPLNAESNTLATVTPPSRMFKVYAWKKLSEKYITQEVILAPRQLKPKQVDEFEYFLTLTAPLAKPAYSSPLLNLEVRPHPMGLPASTQQLTLNVAATRTLGDVDASGRLKRLDAIEAPQSVQLHFTHLNPQSIATASTPVRLTAKGRYQLELNLTRGGKVLLPGAEIGDNDPVRIPLVVDEVLPQAISYPIRTGGNHFPKRQPQKAVAPLAARADGISVYRVPATQRVFEADTLQPSTPRAQPVTLEAGANEYQSFQLVLASQKQAPSTFSVEATPLKGKETAQVEVDRVSRFLYAETKVPSSYNASYGLGRYPDALLETKEIEVQPGITAPLYITYHVAPGTPPGEYHGSISLKSGGKTLTVPVTMRVWNFELPVRPALDVIADPKSGGKDVIPMYFRYKVTPAYLPNVNAALLSGDFATVEKNLPPWIDRGMTKTYLGNTVHLIKELGPERIRAIDKFLKDHNWTDYFYVRPGFDEASSDKVPEIRKAAQDWKALSSIPIMETYYYGSKVEQLYGLLDIYSRSFSKEPWIRERMKAGDKFWRVNAFPAVLENEPRATWALYLAMADYGFTGTYIWTLTSWREAEWGKDWWADDGPGNLSASLIWKHESGLLPTIRLESLRDAIEAYTLYDLLKKRVARPQPKDSPQLLQRAHALLGEPPLWKRIKTDADVEKIYRELGEVLSGLNG
jgi:hypothetical protein